ncbi:hypothetical protein Aph01nite_03760 [Acrocarpospora phusangensis]|uniref:Secreted protein n=1 Tax=Acrocarpospora phusangensis TaxID=1070424 RepID=A0A919UHY4_9ACTN|nr:DUF5719 family protein [Acrocarpospora phusangensis]GIH22066.1 hypothetical protein Aph01nite_03760 [Acrocarpospora phusangensis]
MRRLIENRFGLLALVLIALGAVYGGAFVSRPAPVKPATAQPVKAAIESVSAVCPDPGGATVSAVTPPGPRGSGQAQVLDGDKPATLSEAGKLWQKTAGKDADPIRVVATGAMAAGLEAARISRTLDGDGRGLSGVRCVEPGASAWFVGPGPASADLTLHLSNVEAAPADVSFEVYAGEGLVVAERSTGMVLKPGQHRTVKLRDVTTSPLVMGLHVITSRGRVTAAVEAVLGRGKGADWLPQAGEPATTVVVPGVPGSAGQRRLYLTVPGEQDTVVQVKAVLKDGSYALKNREEISVPAGSTTTMDLSTGIGGQPAALVLTSPVPIVAGLELTGTGTLQDVAFLAGAPSLDLGSVVADGRAGKNQTSRLVLSAPFGAAAVQVQLLPKSGALPAPSEVEIPAGRTREIKLTGDPKGFSVVVTPRPGSGPVYGGRVIEEKTSSGQLVTAQPLQMARTWALVPPTVDSPRTVLP